MPSDSVVGFSVSYTWRGDSAWGETSDDDNEELNNPSWVVNVDIDKRYRDRYPIQKLEIHDQGSLRSRPVAQCSRPSNLTIGGGKIARYQVKLKRKPLSHVVAKLVGHSGRTTEFEVQLLFVPGGSYSSGKQYADLLRPSRSHGRETVVPLPSNQSFGIELELSEKQGTSRSTIARIIEEKACVDVTIVKEYLNAHNPIPSWKLVPDGSIHCSPSDPHCNTFELVSPILYKAEGLEECYHVVHALKSSRKVSIGVNSSMGFHVHVGVAEYGLDEFKRICQNYVIFEEAFDALIAGSRIDNNYCQSCKASITNPSGTIAKLNHGRVRAIQACTSLKQLCQKMNPEGRYYKLNLQNLVTGRQPTIEFRQHQGTANATKVIAWVRFCIAFVNNSARGETPKALPNKLSTAKQVGALFDKVIKDPVLKRYYEGRQSELSKSKMHNKRHACCHGCGGGGSCAGR